MIPQRNPKSPRILEVRPLVEADLELLRQKSASGVSRVKNLRDSHHNVARLIATGLRLPEVAERTGYGVDRIYQLSVDPSVKELVAKYRAIMDESYKEAVDELNQSIVKNATKAERMIGDHLDACDEEGERPPLRELIALTADRYDRIGYGKKNMNVNVNVDFAKQLEAAIARTKRIAAE